MLNLPSGLVKITRRDGKTKVRELFGVKIATKGSSLKL